MSIVLVWYLELLLISGLSLWCLFGSSWTQLGEKWRGYPLLILSAISAALTAQRRAVSFLLLDLLHQVLKLAGLVLSDLFELEKPFNERLQPVLFARHLLVAELYVQCLDRGLSRMGYGSRH